MGVPLFGYRIKSIFVVVGGFRYYSELIECRSYRHRDVPILCSILSEYAEGQVYCNDEYRILLKPLVETLLQKSFPFLSTFLFAFLLSIGTRFSPPISRNIRFNAQQAVLIDMVVLLPTIVQEANGVQFCLVCLHEYDCLFGYG